MIRVVLRGLLYSDGSGVSGMLFLTAVLSRHALLEGETEQMKDKSSRTVKPKIFKFLSSVSRITSSNREYVIASKL